MPRLPRPFRSLVIAAVAAAVPTLALMSISATPALAQASGYAAEIAEIDVAGKRITLKASMGQQTMRVAPGVALDTLAPGDKVLITFGQDGNEAIITRIVKVKP
jgi:Cu/Ag efflux protein CusF